MLSAWASNNRKAFNSETACQYFLSAVGISHCQNFCDLEIDELGYPPLELMVLMKFFHLKILYATTAW